MTAVLARRGRHVIPDGEAGHTATAACPCDPFQQGAFDGDCRIEWIWVHEPGRLAKKPASRDRQ